MSKLPILALSSILWGCGQAQTAGGAGTDAGNAVSVLALRLDGSAAVGARVEARPADQLPSSASESPLWSGTTDSTGRVTFSPGAGTWSVLVRDGTRAFRVRIVPGSHATDTLRPCAVLTGFLQGRAGGTIRFKGLGTLARIGTDGFFRAEDLPSGTAEWEAVSEGTSSRGSVRLEPGTTTIVDTSGPGVLADTLLDRPSAGDSLASTHVPDTGSWALALSLLRDTARDTAWFVAWDSAGSGIRVGALGSDTLVLGMDGNWRKIAGLPVAGPGLRAGLRIGDGSLEVFLDGQRVLQWTGSGVSARGGWGAVRLGTLGVSAIPWAGTRTGSVPDSWFELSP